MPWCSFICVSWALGSLSFSWDLWAYNFPHIWKYLVIISPNFGGGFYPSSRQGLQWHVYEDHWWFCFHSFFFPSMHFIFDFSYCCVFKIMTSNLIYCDFISCIIIFIFQVECGCLRELLCSCYFCNV